MLSSILSFWKKVIIDEFSSNKVVLLISSLVVKLVCEEDVLSLDVLLPQLIRRKILKYNNFFMQN